VKQSKNRRGGFAGVVEHKERAIIEKAQNRTQIRIKHFGSGVLRKERGIILNGEGYDKNRQNTGRATDCRDLDIKHGKKGGPCI